VERPDHYRCSTPFLSLQPPAHPAGPGDYSTSTTSAVVRPPRGSSPGPVHIDSPISHHASLEHCTASPRVAQLRAWSPSFPADRHHGPSVHIVGRLLHSVTLTVSHTAHTGTRTVRCTVSHSCRLHPHGADRRPQGRSRARGAAASHTQRAHAHGPRSPRRDDTPHLPRRPYRSSSALPYQQQHSSTARITGFSLRTLFLLARPPARVSTPRFLCYVCRIYFALDVPYGSPQPGDRLHS
jgi:hypothetical protein